MHRSRRRRQTIDTDNTRGSSDARHIHARTRTHTRSGIWARACVCVCVCVHMRACVLTLTDPFSQHQSVERFGTHISISCFLPKRACASACVLFDLRCSAFLLVCVWLLVLPIDQLCVCVCRRRRVVLIVREFASLWWRRHDKTQIYKHTAIYNKSLAIIIVCICVVAAERTMLNNVLVMCGIRSIVLWFTSLHCM